MMAGRRTHPKRNKDLRDIWGDNGRDLGYRRNFERRANDDHQIHEVPIMIEQAITKGGGQGFSEKRDIRLPGSVLALHLDGSLDSPS